MGTALEDFKNHVVDGVMASELFNSVDDKVYFLGNLGLDVPNRKVKVLVEFELTPEAAYEYDSALKTVQPLLSEVWVESFDVLSAVWVDEEIL